MTDVQILDIRVPIELYKALNPVRAVGGPYFETAMVERMVTALREFLKEVAHDAYRDSGFTTRSGKMKRSLDKGLQVFGGIRVNDIHAHFVVPEYVAAHEYGAKILPKKAKVLCIPLPSALRADGTPKRRYPALWKPMGTFSYKSKKTGKAYLAYKDGRSGKLVILYAFVDFVQLKERLGLRKHYRDMLPILLAAWEGIIAEEMAKAYGTFMTGIGRLVE